MIVEYTKNPSATAEELVKSLRDSVQMALNEINNAIGVTSVEVTVDTNVENTDSSENILDKVYPVGAIYMSVVNTDPSVLFGGSWERWGKGQVAVGVDESDSTFSEAEKTGGEKTHKLTVNEMPEHQHAVNYRNNLTGNGSAVGMTTPTYKTATTSIANGTEARGGSAAHNNLQPYITCYMWKRTA